MDNFAVVFTHSIKRAHEIRKFHVAVVQRRLRNIQKSVMHVQSCCFANMNHLLFCRSRCRRRMRCFSSLLLWSRNFATMVTLRHTSPPCLFINDTLVVDLKTSSLSMLWPRFLSQLHRSVSSVSSTWFVLLTCTGVTVFSPSLVLVSQFFGSWILTQTDRGSRSEIGSRRSCRVTSNNKFCL